MRIGLARVRQSHICIARGGRHALQHLLIRSLVAQLHASRCHGLGFAVPVAGVLHQIHLGQQSVGAVFGAAAFVVGYDGGNAVRVYAYGRAQVKTTFVAKKFLDHRGKGQREGLGADAKACAVARLGCCCQGLGKAAKLAGQAVFGGLLQLPNLLLADGVFFVQRAQVACYQSLHQLFDVVVA